tara:strand:- start:4216 stop:4728 length:513 start_codon:yes stop_codon:yes gene_type:complete
MSESELNYTEIGEEYFPGIGGEHNILDFKESPDYFDKLIQSGIPEHSQAALRGLLSQDFVLSYYKERGDLIEMKYLAKAVELMFLASLPPSSSAWIGQFRSFCTNNLNDCLAPLTDAEKISVSIVLLNVIARNYRSRDGFLLENVSKTFSVSEVRGPDKDEQPKRRGLFG